MRQTSFVVCLLLPLLVFTECQGLHVASQHIALLPRGGSRSPSPPKWPQHAGHSSGLLEDIVKHATAKPPSAGQHASQSTPGHPQVHGAHPIQTHSVHPTSGGVTHTTQSDTSSTSKRKKEPWWKKKGGKPHATMGSGKQYDVQRLYRDRKKLRTELKALLEPPPGHPQQHPKHGDGPGSPGTGGASHAVSKRRL